MINHVSQGFKAHFLHPKYMLFWIGIGCMRLLVLLPLSLQFQLGRFLGLTSYHLLKRRRHIADVNISLSCPNISINQQRELVKKTFVNAGIGIFESFSAWWRPKLFDNTVTIEGLEYLEDAQRNGKAVLLYGAHYTMLDLGGLLCANYFKADIVYRPQNSAIREWLIHGGRKAIFNMQIGYRDVKSMVQRLKQGSIVWYTPDQDFGLKNSVQCTFFGVPAATITAGGKLARVGNTCVLGIHFYRTTDIRQKPCYHITLTPALENYPSDDENLDAQRVNNMLESLITKDISQYMWFHRRFKSQPDGKDYYSTRSTH